MLQDLYDVDEDGGITLAVHAQPGAGRSQIVGRHGDALKVRVAAPPEQGRANDALTKMFAETLDLKVSDVAIVSGATSRAKRFRFTGIEPERFLELLELALSGPGNIGRSRRVRGPQQRRPGS